MPTDRENLSMFRSRADLMLEDPLPIPIPIPEPEPCSPPKKPSRNTAIVESQISIDIDEEDSFPELLVTNK